MQKHLLLFFISLTLNSFAQTDPIEQAANTLPPSPTASELGKYGLVPVGLSTGTPNVTIPIYTYSTKSLSVPISLSYSSNGIKVDQIASWVGMGWSLNAGGVITRTIRDRADENNLGFPYPESMFNPDTDAEAIRYLQLAGDDDAFDSEVDLYAFNFQGNSGKFVFDRNGTPIVMPHQNIKIERYLKDGDDDFSGLGDYFVITTADGVAFTFGAVETSKTFSSGAMCGKSYDGQLETSWFLTKIKNPLGDSVNFEYIDNIGYSYKASVSQVVMKKIRNDECATGTNCPVFNDKTCVNQLTVNGKVLKKISASNLGEIEFVSAKPRTDLNDYKLDAIWVKDISGNVIRTINFAYTFSTTNSAFNNTLTSEELKHRMFLSSLTERDAANHAERKHSFEYNDINGLPPRLSFAQDHWGYFNGKPNTSLVPGYLAAADALGNKLFPTGANREPDATFSSKGILTNVTYPTGGSTELQYEPNTYHSSYTQYPSKTQFFFNATGVGAHDAAPKSTVLDNPYTQQVYISATAALDPSFLPNQVDSTHNFADLRILDSDGNVILSRHLRMYATYETYLTLEEGMITIELIPNGDIVDSGIYFEYYATAPTTVHENIPTGGIRIKKVLDADPVHQTTEETNYLYANVSDLSKSSGQMGPAPTYYSESTIRQPCGSVRCLTYDCFYGSLYSSSQTSIYPVGGSHIYYDHVVVSKGTGFLNGVEEHEFLVQFDGPGQLIWGENIINASFTNLGWSNGLEKTVRQYAYSAGSFVVNKEIINNYVKDTRYSKQVNSLVVRKKYSTDCTADAVIPCNASNINKVYQIYTCTNNSHKHHWYIGAKQTNCIAWGHHNVLVTVGWHPCFGKAEGQTAVYPYAIEQFDAIEYTNNAYWFYMDSSTEIIYDENGKNPITTDKKYFYDNPDHGFLSRTTISGSDKITEVRTWYPQDYNSPDNLEALRNNDILSVPIKIEKLVNDKQVEGSVIQYTDYGQPKDVYTYSNDQLVASISHDRTQLIPSSKYEWKGSLTYSSSNNLSEVVSDKAPTTSYLWDYHDSKPVAKVVNAPASKIAYSSFESDGKGNWNYAGIASSDIAVKTGKNYYKLNGGNITKSLDPGTYKLEYWAKGTVTVAGGTIITVSISNADANGWILYQKEITVASTTTLTISGSSSSFIDEVRLSPAGAQMVTSTYDPILGVTSMTDANMITTYYQYDSFGRLQAIADANGNIIKSYTYHYKD